MTCGEGEGVAICNPPEGYTLALPTTADVNTAAVVDVGTGDAAKGQVVF